MSDSVLVKLKTKSFQRVFFQTLLYAKFHGYPLKRLGSRFFQMSIHPSTHPSVVAYILLLK